MCISLLFCWFIICQATSAFHKQVAVLFPDPVPALSLDQYARVMTAQGFTEHLFESRECHDLVDAILQNAIKHDCDHTLKNLFANVTAGGEQVRLMMQLLPAGNGQFEYLLARLPPITLHHLAVTMSLQPVPYESLLQLLKSRNFDLQQMAPVMIKVMREECMSTVILALLSAGVSVTEIQKRWATRPFLEILSGCLPSDCSLLSPFHLIQFGCEIKSANMKTIAKNFNLTRQQAEDALNQPYWRESHLEALNLLFSPAVREATINLLSEADSIFCQLALREESLHVRFVHAHFSDAEIEQAIYRK